MELLKYFTLKPFYDTSDCFSNHLTLKERSLLCLISQKVLKVCPLCCVVLLTSAFSEKKLKCSRYVKSFIKSMWMPTDISNIQHFILHSY